MAGASHFLSGQGAGTLTVTVIGGPTALAVGHGRDLATSLIELEPSGGVGPYKAHWFFVIGDRAPVPLNPTGFIQQWSAPVGPFTSLTATWQWVVTDSAGNRANGFVGVEFDGGIDQLHPTAGAARDAAAPCGRSSNSTGEILKNDLVQFRGYSGHLTGVNDPAICRRTKGSARSRRGSTPSGRPACARCCRPVVMALTLDPANQMFGRSGFFIHGDFAGDVSLAASHGTMRPRPPPETARRSPPATTSN